MPEKTVLTEYDNKNQPDTKTACFSKEIPTVFYYTVVKI